MQIWYPAWTIVPKNTQKIKINESVGPFKIQEEMEIPTEKLIKDSQEFTLPPAWNPNKIFVIENMGNQVKNNRPGNLLIFFNILPNNNFRIRKNNIKHTITLSLKESLIGFEKTIKHPDGTSFQLKSSKPMPPGEIKKIKNKGLNHNNGIGDFIIDFKDCL